MLWMRGGDALLPAESPRQPDNRVLGPATVCIMTLAVLMSRRLLGEGSEQDEYGLFT